MILKSYFILVLSLLASNAFGLSCSGRPSDKIIGECVAGKCVEIIRIKETGGSFCKIIISIEPLSGWEKELLEFKLMKYPTDNKIHIYELNIRSSLRESTTTKIRADIAASLKHKINIFPLEVRQLESTDMKELTKDWKEKEYKQNKSELTSKIKNWISLIISVVLVLFTIKKFYSRLKQKGPLINLLPPVFNQILIFGIIILIVINNSFSDSYTLIQLLLLIIPIVWTFEFIAVLMTWSLRLINKDDESKS